MLREVLALTDATLSRLPLDDFLAELLARVRAAVAADSAATLQPAADGSSLTLGVASGFGPPFSARLPIAGSVEGRALASGAPVAVADRAPTAPDLTALPPTTRSVLAIPLVICGRSIGVLSLGRAVARAFSADEVRLGEIAADRVAGALECGFLGQRLASAEESEQKYRNLLDNLPQRVIYKDRDSVYLAINPAYSKDIGISPADVVGKTDFDLNPRETAEKYRADDRRIMATGVAEEFDEPLVVHGRTITIHTVKAPVRDAAGNVVGVVVIFWDVTEGKAAEEALRRSEQRLRLLVEGTPLGVVEWDTDFRVVRWNRAAEEIFGYRADEVLGRDAHFIVHPDDWPRVDETWRALLATRGGERRQNRNVTKDGRTIVCDWYNSPLTDADGQVIGVASLVDDVTAEVQARERERAERIRLATLAELGQREAAALTVPAICERVIDRGVEITDSEYGYLFLYDEETGILTNCAWSKGALPSGVMEECQRVCSIDEAGDWGEAIRQRRPIVVNDSAALGDLGKENPKGYPHPNRQMSLPVFEGDRIVALVGVANKAEPYDEDDVRQLQLLLDGAWQIVQRTRGEEALRVSEERFRAIFEQAAVGIVQVDLQRRFLEINQRYCDIAGYPCDELLGLDVLAITHPDDLASDAALFDRLSRGEITNYTIEKRYVHKDGSIAWVSVTVSPLRDSFGEPRGGIGIVQDISDRRAAEAERERLLAEQVDARKRIEDLAETAQRRAAELQSVLDSMVEGIIVVGADRRVTLVNGAASAILGVSADDLLGYNFAELPGILRMRHPDGQPFDAGELALSSALDGVTVVAQDEIIRNPLTGRNVYVRVGAAPIRASDGRVTGAVLVVQDVSALTELDRLKDQFIAVAAHELKTPVTIMKGYAQTLERSGANLSAGQQRMLDAIIRGSNRIDRTIHELLDISRLSVGRLDLNLERVDLSALVAEAAEGADITAPLHRVRVVGADPAVVRADPARIDQVLANLLDNAVRYSPDGGDVDLRVRVEGREAVVSVTDRGIGIPASEQSRVFERFYRAHTGTPYDYGGMGVSLYISREIVELHGGRIWFASEEGKGSTFFFSLPLSTD